MFRFRGGPLDGARVRAEDFPDLADGDRISLRDPAAEDVQLVYCRLGRYLEFEICRPFAAAAFVGGPYDGLRRPVEQFAEVADGEATVLPPTPPADRPAVYVRAGDTFTYAPPAPPAPPAPVTLYYGSTLHC